MMRRMYGGVIAALLLFVAPVQAAITFVGTATSTPADGGANATEPITITPVTGLVTGDLVIVTTAKQEGGITFSNSTTGGQTWASCGSGGAVDPSLACFYATFDGTWTADPAFDADSNQNIFTLVMTGWHSDVAHTWAIDVAGAYASFASGTAITITGITLTSTSFALAVWWTDENAGVGQTWGSLSGAGWSKTGLAAQYRNTSGADHSGTLAYFIGTGATGNVSQTVGSASAGATFKVGFKEVATTILAPRGSLLLGDVGR